MATLSEAPQRDVVVAENVQRLGDEELTNKPHERPAPCAKLIRRVMR
jgi:hypothetical protein